MFATSDATFLKLDLLTGPVMDACQWNTEKKTRIFHWHIFL